MGYCIFSVRATRPLQPPLGDVMAIERPDTRKSKEVYVQHKMNAINNLFRMARDIGDEDVQGCLDLQDQIKALIPAVEKAAEVLHANGRLK